MERTWGLEKAGKLIVWAETATAMKKELEKEVV